MGYVPQELVLYQIPNQRVLLSPVPGLKAFHVRETSPEIHEYRVQSVNAVVDSAGNPYWPTLTFAARIPPDTAPFSLYGYAHWSSPTIVGESGPERSSEWLFPLYVFKRGPFAGYPIISGKDTLQSYLELNDRIFSDPDYAEPYMQELYDLYGAWQPDDGISIFGKIMMGLSLAFIGGVIASPLFVGAEIAGAGAGEAAGAGAGAVATGAEAGLIATGAETGLALEAAAGAGMGIWVEPAVSSTGFFSSLGTGLTKGIKSVGTSLTAALAKKHLCRKYP